MSTYEFRREREGAVLARVDMGAQCSPPLYCAVDSHLLSVWCLARAPPFDIKCNGNPGCAEAAGPLPTSVFYRRSPSPGPHVQASEPG